MKIKQTLWLTNSTSYMKGYAPSFSLTDHDEGASGSMLEYGWVKLNDIEINAELDQSAIITGALAGLDAKETELRAQYQIKLKEIENARNDLKALTWEQTA